MAYVNLERESYLLDDGNESKVIIRDLADVPGGRALDVSAVTDTVIKAGTIIKHNTSTGEYAPLGVTDGAYAALGANEEYVGVLKTSVLTKKPAAAILTMGEVNAAALPVPVTAAIKSALSQIKFI